MESFTWQVCVKKEKMIKERGFGEEILMHLISTEINTYLPAQNHITLTTGITNKKIDSLNNFESIDISQSITNKRGYILNTGASIWAIEFVPKPASLHCNHSQYLAVGGYNSTHEHYTFENNPCVPNAIQIWKCTSDTSVIAKPQLDMCLLHDFGVVVDFKWCPYSVYDTKDKLGIVAVLFGNGEIKVFVVPHPQLIRDQENIPVNETVYCKLIDYVHDSFLHILSAHICETKKKKTSKNRSCKT